MNNTTENGSALVPSLGLYRSLDIPDQKKHYLDSLLRSLDGIVFLHLGIIYLCDNLTFLLLLRAVSQVLHVQYRPPGSTFLAPVIFATFGCIVAHLLQEQPDGKQLHGGLIVDFVGELAPSRWRIVFLDLIVLGLQLVMLVAGYEKQLASGEVQAQDAPLPQDIDSEEAGRHRSEAPEPANETEEGIELQNLIPDGHATNEVADQKEPEATEDDDLIVLDMRRGLKALLRRPPPTATPALENPAARAGLASFLARVAAARARAG